MDAMKQTTATAEDSSEGPATKRMRQQVLPAQESYVHSAPPHLLPASAAMHSPQLHVQNLYQMQLPPAPLNHPVLPNRVHSGSTMLELPPHDEAEHQLQESLTEKHALDRLDSPEAEVIGAPASGDYRNKQRRKANERPTGTDQMRQAFSKRKRGLALKCYQLHKLTDAKVFCFIMNEKGTSWAYATPGFGASLSNSSLRHMRSLTGFEQPADVSKQVTEVIPHPAAGDPDDREMYVAAGQPIDATPSAVLVGGPDYDAEPDVISCGATREVGVQVSSHLQTLYPALSEGPLPPSDAQAGPDEVRNFVADLAHLAYSRGLPGGPAGSAPMAQPDGMGTGLQPQAALMQQAMMNVPVPVHMIPGHPSFDQHAYNLLMQQQQQHQEQQLQHQQQQEQYEAHQQHQHVEVQTADAHGDVKRISEAQHALPASELSQDAARQGHRIEHPLPTSGGET